jgi:hypothetical protein
VDALRVIAEPKGATVAQVAIGWVLSRGEDVVPLIGARRRDRLAEALGALDIELTQQDLEAIERAVPRGSAAGDRYHAPQMASLDSERGEGPYVAEAHGAIGVRMRTGVVESLVGHRCSTPVGLSVENYGPHGLAQIRYGAQVRKVPARILYRAEQPSPSGRWRRRASEEDGCTVVRDLDGRDGRCGSRRSSWIDGRRRPAGHASASSEGTGVRS